MSRTPESIGKYKIVSEIAKGGMGAVFKAIHPTLKRPVILKKLMLKSRKSLVERFKREARIMMDFRNENIVDVYDHFKEGTSYYIVLEYIDGVSLDQLIRQERYLQEDLALYIFMDACKALKYAHDKGVIHRDIKPANILISRNGEIKLVDFGIAVSVEDDEAGLTKEGMTLGTPSYMAPEQFENTKNVDKRADIYSMGVMLYEMVTGKKPFPGSLSAEAIAAIHKGKYVNPKKINPEITGKSLGIIKKSMRPKTQKRYQDLQPIIRKLQRSFSPSKEAEVKEHLTALVEGKAWIPTEKKPSPFRFLFPAFLIAAVLSTGGFFAVQAGLHYEYLLPNSAGAVEFRLFIPADSRGPENLNVYSGLFTESENQLSRFEALPRIDFEYSQAESGAMWSYRSGKLYLPPGNYRIRVEYDDVVLWRTFYLEPRTFQQQSAATADAMNISLGNVPVRSLPIDMNFRAVDRITGEDISAESRLFVKREGNWVPVTSQATSFLSGNSYELKIETQGYFSEYAVVHTANRQRFAKINFHLQPVPGTLTLRPSIEGIQWQLNNNGQYITGNEDPLLARLPELSTEGTSLFLSPGNYTLQVSYRGRTAETNFTVSTEEALEYIITWDTQERVLRLE